MSQFCEIKLYSFANFDRSARVRWLLYQLDLSFEEVRLNFKEKQQQSAEYRKINPLAKVPTVTVDGLTIFESGAIFHYFLQKVPDHQLIPEDDHRLAEYLSWFFFACNEFDNKVAKIYFPNYVFHSDEVKGVELFHQLKPTINIIIEHLAKNQYIVGNQFTAVDIFLASQLQLLNRANLLNDFPRLLSYLDQFTNHPAASKAQIFSSD